MPRARASKIVCAFFFAVSACGGDGISPRSVPAPAPSPPGSALPRALSTAPAPPAKRTDDRFAVATENQDAARAAVEVLRAGGNAFDAAVAGVLVAGVAQPASTGLGGDGFAVGWNAKERRAFAIDFRARAPKKLSRNAHVGRTPPRKKRGVMVGVPGEIAGLARLHEHRGKLPWHDVVARAADAADHGVSVSPYMAQAFAWLREEAPGAKLETAFGLDPNAKDASGETLRSPALAKTLRAIADGGARAFYEGDIADDVVDMVSDAGGELASSDLARYEADETDALDVRWEGFDVFVPRAPSAGGFEIAEMLGLFSKADLAKLGQGSGDYVHFLAEGFRLANADAGEAIGDPELASGDPSTLLDPARLAAKRAAFRADATTLPKQPSVTTKGTFHFVVIDADENVVSVTTTMTSLFGSRILTRSGFLLGDPLIEFAMDDYGQRVLLSGANLPRGGARPASSMAPAIVVKDGRVVAALGASGGYRIPAAVSEVLFAHLAFDAPVDEAVAAPRFFTTPTGTLVLDSGLDGLAGDLRSRGEIVDARKNDFGAVSALTIDRSTGVRVVDAVGDPRKHGVAVVVPGGE